MIKNMLSLLMALLLALTLTGCGTSGGGDGLQDAKAQTTELQDASDQHAGNASDDAAASDARNASRIGALHVSDGKLITEDGEPIQLQGISTHGLSWFPQYVNKEMMRQARDEWGCSVFRLAMYTAEYNGYLTGDEQNRETLKALIHQAVQDAEELGMYLIIDWHTLSDNDPLVNVDEASAFFAALSEQYADKTHIIYEICNEPNGGATWENVKAYAQQVIPKIRENSDAVILVGTPNWCQQPDLALADPIENAENVMYTLHFYAATHKDDLRRTLQDVIDAKLPVFVSEFGICDASGSGQIDEAEADKWLALMNENGVSYTMWNLSNKDESSAMIRSDCNSTSGIGTEDLSPAGIWFTERNR